MPRNNFKLSSRSLGNLEGVYGPLVQVVHRAIEITEIDFGVIEGVRSLETQKEYVEAGVSQTMKSRHITGHAVDLLAYLGSRGSWEMSLYFKIADAMKKASLDLCVDIRWGGAWTVNNLTNSIYTGKEAHTSYLEVCSYQGRRPFIDGPHFEVVRNA